MIKNQQRYQQESERERVAFLQGLTYAESIQRTEELLTCGLLEQVRIQREDHPVDLYRLLHGHRR